MIIAWARLLVARYHYGRAERSRAAGRLAAAHRAYARAARGGYVQAQYMIARAHQLGQGCVRSGALAEHWYRVAAEGGHTQSKFELGLILLAPHDLGWYAGPSAAWMSHRASHEKTLTGKLFPAVDITAGHPALAFYWLLQAAEAGLPEAQANVGWLLLTGTGCNPDRTEAHKWLLSSSNHNLGQAALGLAEYYGLAGASDYDPTRSAHWAKRASELGNGSGSRSYGLSLRDGIGVELNSTEAEKYLFLAAEQGHPIAGYDAALLVLARESTLDEYQLIVEQLRRTAKRNHAPSAMLLANIYSRGQGLKQDLREAALWYNLAADLGNIEAHFMMGCLYARGDGVVIDLKHACRYFELAAGEGHVQAAFNLAIFRLTGRGVDRDVTLAKRWLTVAAEAGLAQAQLKLGQLLEEEAATPDESSSARLLIEQAARSGSSDAKVLLAKSLLIEKGEKPRLRSITLLREAVEQGNVEACKILLNEVDNTDIEAILSKLNQMIDNNVIQAKVVVAEAMLINERLPLNFGQAISLLNDAASAGDPQAIFLIGVVYCQGNHVNQDLKKGFDYYLQAANLGHAFAQYNAGIMLLQGVGALRNTETGIFWIRQAGANNLQKAIEFIRDVEQRASESEPTSIGHLA